MREKLDDMLPLVKKKCLSSSRETGLAIAVHYTKDVIRVSRATEVYLQLSESTLERASSYAFVQVDGFLAKKQ